MDTPPPDLTKARDTHGRPLLTVGQLKELLAAAADDDHVVLAAGDWFANVDSVAVPRRDANGESLGGYECVTLFPGADFDARQI